MWNGTEVVNLSDESPSHRLSLWRYDTVSGERKPLTDFADYDVKWPSIGPRPDGRGEVVFEHGGRLHLFELATRRARTVDVRIPGARPQLRSRPVNVTGLVTNASLSLSARRVSWSSDSRWVAYTRGSDNWPTSIWIYDVCQGEAHRVTSGRFADTWPTFDSKGDFLCFASLRDFFYDPGMHGVDWEAVRE